MSDVRLSCRTSTSRSPCGVAGHRADGQPGCAAAVSGEFLRDGKQTREELYAWMQAEVSRLYYEYYRFAVDPLDGPRAR
jgi:hypothetical protein